MNTIWRRCQEIYLLPLASSSSSTRFSVAIECQTFNGWPILRKYWNGWQKKWMDCDWSVFHLTFVYWGFLGGQNKSYTPAIPEGHSWNTVTFTHIKSHIAFHKWIEGRTNFHFLEHPKSMLTLKLWLSNIQFIKAHPDTFWQWLHSGIFFSGVLIGKLHTFAKSSIGGALLLPDDMKRKGKGRESCVVMKLLNCFSQCRISF